MSNYAGFFPILPSCGPTDFIEFVEYELMQLSMEEAHKATIKAKMPLGHKMLECSLHTQSAFENSLERRLEVMCVYHLQ
jgi:hypothetical protein